MASAVALAVSLLEVDWLCAQDPPPAREFLLHARKSPRGLHVGVPQHGFGKLGSLPKQSLILVVFCLVLSIGLADGKREVQR